MQATHLMSLACTPQGKKKRAAEEEAEAAAAAGKTGKENKKKKRATKKAKAAVDGAADSAPADGADADVDMAAADADEHDDDVKAQQPVGSGRRAAQGVQYKDKDGARARKDDIIIAEEEPEAGTEADAIRETQGERPSSTRRWVRQIGPASGRMGVPATACL